MTIMLGITKKGFKDICIVGNNCKEGEEYLDLYHIIGPELKAFEQLINEKLKTATVGAESD